MDEIHQKVVKLKYQGLTHEQISMSVNGQLTKGTLDVYFSKGGLLYDNFIEYESLINKEKMKEAIRNLKKESNSAVQVIIRVMKEAEKKGNYLIALKAAEIVLDRIGITASKKDKVSEINPEETFEKFVEKSGFDPITGLPTKVMDWLKEDL